MPRVADRTTCNRSRGAPGSPRRPPLSLASSRLDAADQDPFPEPGPRPRLVGELLPIEGLRFGLSRGEGQGQQQELVPEEVPRCRTAEGVAFEEVLHGAVLAGPCLHRLGAGRLPHLGRAVPARRRQPPPVR